MSGRSTEHGLERAGRGAQRAAQFLRCMLSTAEPDRRRSQATVIRPRIASMVRMRSGSIPIKGSS